MAALSFGVAAGCCCSKRSGQGCSPAGVRLSTALTAVSLPMRVMRWELGQEGTPCMSVLLMKLPSGALLKNAV